MKILITENQLEKIINNYFIKMIKRMKCIKSSYEYESDDDDEVFEKEVLEWRSIGRDTIQMMLHPYYDNELWMDSDLFKEIENVFGLNKKQTMIAIKINMEKIYSIKISSIVKM